MASLRSTHIHDRRKPCAVELEDGDVVGACCASELLEDGLVGYIERTPLGAVEVERRHGRSRRCDYCDARILEPDGLPAGLLVDV